jgi:hypothetical protein
MPRLSINFEKIIGVPMGSVNSTIRSWSFTHLLLLFIIIIIIIIIIINDAYFN